MKKIIAAVFAILCVAGSATMISKSPSNLKSQGNSIVAYAAEAAAEPGINASNYSYEYADTSVYTTKITQNKKIANWTDNGNTYGVFTITITGNDTNVTLNRIGLIKANDTILDYSFSDLSLSSIEDACKENGISIKELGKRATIIADSAFTGSYLKTIDLTGIEYIGNKAFNKCTYITEITIPETVKYVGTGTFDSSGLKTLHVLNEMPVIPDNFCSGTQLTDIDFAHPEYIRKIGKAAFKGSPVAAPIFNEWGSASGYETLTVGESAYENCTSIKSVKMSDNVRLLNISSFKGCTALADVTFGKNTVGADKESFANCTALDTINFNDCLEALGGGVFSGCTSLKKVDGMPDTLTDWVKVDSNTGYGFGNNMFAGCTSLVSATLPSSLTKVPEATFSGCTSLITIIGNSGNQDNIIEIEKDAFKGCTSLIETLYNNVIIAGDGAFASCTSLKDIKIPNLATAGKTTFMDCTSVEKIDFPALSDIGDECFKNCNMMTSFHVGVCSKVGKNALEGCVSLPEIELISSKYGDYVFKDCSGATKISVNFDDMDGKTPKGFFSGCSALTSVGGDLSKIVILSPFTFEKCEALENIDLSSIRIIEESAFSECTSLKSICSGAIEAEDYGKKCFYKCNNLSAVVKGNISTIGESAFQFSGITGIEINGMVGGTFVIGKSAFADCPDLKYANVTSPTDVVFSVGASVFSNSAALTKVVYSGPILTASMFADCTSLASVNTNADSIQQNAFAGCTNLKDLTDISGSTKIVAKDIGSNAFKNCESLPYTVSNKNTTFTGTNQYEGCASIKTAEVSALTVGMFMGCTSLESADIGSVVAIPNSAFQNCSSLTNIDLTKVVTVGMNSFNNSGLKTLKIESASSIGKSAFTGCKKLQKIDVSAETIDANAFAEDTALEEAVLHVKTINDKAFFNCASLRSVLFQTSDTRSLSKLGTNAFMGCNILYEVIVPGNPTIGAKALGFNSKALNADFLLVGEPGSTVEKYATSNKVPFADINTFDIGDRTTGRDTPGDVDGNGIISISDAVKLQNWLINKEPYGVVKANMDLNKDGSIDVFDMILMRKKVSE